METMLSNKKPVGFDLKRLTVRDMVGPLFRNWGIVLVVFSVIFLCAIFVAWGWARHYYVASMQVVVARERSDPTVTPNQNAAVDNHTAVTADEVASEIALLQGRDMLEQVTQSCQLTKRESLLRSLLNRPSAEDKSPQASAAAAQALAAKLRVEAHRASHVIDVRYGHWGAPEIPACVLQSLGKLYLEKHLRLQRPAGSFDFFAQQTEKYQQALAESESRLVNFSKTEGVAAPEILRAGTAQELAAAQSAFYQARQRIAAGQQRMESIRIQMSETPPRSSTAETSLSANILLEQLQSSLLNSQLKRTQLLLKYEPTYPLVTEVDAEIAQTKEAIAAAEAARYVNTTTDRDSTFEYLRQEQAKTQADLASEQATAAALSTTIREIELQMVKLDAKTVEQGALLRDTKANEGNYLLYLTKREQERTSDALDAKRIANVAVAVPATVPVLTAYSPSWITFVGFWLAVLGGITAGYLRELANPSFRTPAEVEETLNLAVLAAVPRQVA